MSFYLAVLYRLFAQTTHPARTLRVRSVLFVVAMSLMGVLVYRLTPIGFSAEGFDLAAVVAVTICLVSTLYFLLDGYQKSLVQRLEMVHHLPLNQWRVRICYGLSFVPVTLLCSVVCVPMISQFFSVAWPLPLAFCLFAASCHCVLRIAFSKFAQSIRIGMLLYAGFISWSLYDQHVSLAAYLSLGSLVAVQLTLIILAVHTKVLGRERLIARSVRERKRINLVASVCLRALRNTRYRGATTLLAIVWLGLSLLAATKPAAVPYDAVVVVAIVLLGTVVQETRYLSSRIYPLELVRFGMVGKWLIAMWLLAGCTAAVWLTAIYVATFFFFDNELSVGLGYTVMLACCLAAGGLTLACVLAPHRNDILAQLLATAAYGIAVWLIFKLFAQADQLWMPWLTVSFIVGGFGVAYLAERWRWIVTIRRKHGYLL